MRRHDERTKRRRISSRIFVVARIRDGAPLLVSAALVLAARARPDLLADSADVHVGLAADLYRSAEWRARPGRADIHRRGDVVGYLVPRTTRLFHFIS